VDGQSEAAFEEFVRCRQATLFGTVFLLSGDRDHAEDLLQGALERTCLHCRRVAAAGNPDAYVLWVPKTCATWADFGPSGDGMIFGLWA
jgi:DNA-directed RNA polymerase specialized sigma24 family protein